MTIYSCCKVLGSQCHYSMHYCCCIPEIHAFVPKLCRPIIYQDKHNRLSKTSRFYCFLSVSIFVVELLRTLDQAPCTSPPVIEAAGQRYRQTMQFLYLCSLIDASADIVPEIKRRVRLAWACYRFKRELYDMESAPFALKLRMQEAEMMETLLYGCVTLTLGKERFAEMRTARHRFLLRIIGFQRRQSTYHLMSYAKALKKGTMR